MIRCRFEALLGLGFGLSPLLLSGLVNAAGAPRTHDNLFFRGGALGGYGWVRYDAPLGTGVHHRGRATGTTFGLDLALGGTLSPGIVLGGMVIVHSQYNPDFDNPLVTQGWDSTSNSFAGALAFGRVYPYPQIGFHVEALAGPIAYRTRHEVHIDVNPYTCPAIFPDCWDDHNQTLETSEGAPGYGLGAGVGHELWVGDQLSLGVAARIEYARASRGSRTYSFLIPGVALSCTYH